MFIFSNFLYNKESVTVENKNSKNNLQHILHFDLNELSSVRRIYQGYGVKLKKKFS
jgi:hypothetical protein